MKKHVLRPLWVALAVVFIILIGRYFLVPSDFGVHGRNFTYGFHRLSNVDEWRDFRVKYKGKETCEECHPGHHEENLSSYHAAIECENCHGPALDHPENPEVLDIDRTRLLCLRCHAYLPYPGNKRNSMKSIEPKEHNPGEECVSCHNPHNPSLEDME
jgi:hypothetical protein